jgi:tetratricopeptide (TPR) repeat protein
MGGKAVIGRLLGVLVFSVSLGVMAVPPAETFSAANVSYEQGRFAEAAALYESVITNNAATASAWFNLGNARFKAGEPGRAIAAWRNAERLTPRDAALRANLAFVRRKAAGDQELQANTIDLLAGYFTPNEWAAATAVAWVVLFSILAMTEWRAGAAGSKRPSLLLAVVGIATLLLGGAAAMTYVDYYKRTEVVTVRQAAARLGPLDDSQIAFQVNEGSEFLVLDTTSIWVQVENRNKKVGWLKRADVAFVPAAAPRRR